jgi:hypothetical protein
MAVKIAIPHLLLSSEINQHNLLLGAKTGKGFTAAK